MIEQLHDSVSPIVIESAVASALLWVLALSFLRWFRVADPALRAAAFSLPLFLPVAVTTTFHVLIPARPSAASYFKPLEAFIEGSLALSAPLLILLLLAGIAGVVASLVLVWRHRLAWERAHRVWEGQWQDNSPLRQRCNGVLNALAARLGAPIPRLVLVAESGAGSLALWRPGYIFVLRALAERLDDEELEALLAHEMAHIVRRDSLLSFLARICRNLMLFNPLAYLAVSRFEREQEQAADDFAVRMGSNRLAMASCLLKGYRAGGSQLGLDGVGLINDSDMLEQRVRRMIHGPAPQPPKRVAWLALGLLAGGVTFAFVLAI